MTSTSEIHPDYAAVAHGQAVAAARRWGRYVEYDDLYQELWVYALRNIKEVNALLDPAPEEGEDEPSKRQLRNCLTRLERRVAKAAERYVRKLKAQQLGYEVGDEYFYTRETVEMLLPIVLSGDFDTLPQHEDNGGRRIKTAPNEGNNLPAMTADVSAAVSTLSEDQLELLADVFLAGPGVSPSEAKAAVARREDVSRWAIDGRVNRIIERIIVKLGGGNPYERSRPVSTAHAVAITRRQEEG